MAAWLPMHGKTPTSTLHYANNGATRRQLPMQNSLALLRGEFERYRYRFAPPIGSLKPKDLSNTPHHRIMQPHTSLRSESVWAN
jgi:hypothetical protein